MRSFSSLWMYFFWNFHSEVILLGQSSLSVLPSFEIDFLFFNFLSCCVLIHSPPSFDASSIYSRVYISLVLKKIQEKFQNKSVFKPFPFCFWVLSFAPAWQFHCWSSAHYKAISGHGLTQICQVNYQHISSILNSSQRVSSHWSFDWVPPGAHTVFRCGIFLHLVHILKWLFYLEFSLNKAAA